MCVCILMEAGFRERDRVGLQGMNGEKGFSSCYGGQDLKLLRSWRDDLVGESGQGTESKEGTGGF